MAGRDLCQNGYDKVRDEVRDKVSLSGGPRKWKRKLKEGH